MLASGLHRRTQVCAVPLLCHAQLLQDRFHQYMMLYAQKQRSTGRDRPDLHRSFSAESESERVCVYFHYCRLSVPEGSKPK